MSNIQLRTVNRHFSRTTHIELVKGKEYYYFVFDDGKRFETLSVMVARLNDLTLAQWIEEGNQFAAKQLGVEHV